jgi:hypothetical protein
MQLASEIGAEPVEPTAEPAPPSPPQEPETFDVPRPAAVAPRPPAEPIAAPPAESGPSWDDLARELGIEVPPPPPGTAAEAAGPAEEPPSAEALSDEALAEAADFLSREEAEVLLFGGERPLPPPLPEAAEAPPAGDRNRRRRKRRDRNRDRDQKPPARQPDSSEEGPVEDGPATWRTARDFEAEDIVASDDSADLLFDEGIEELPSEGLSEPPPRRHDRRPDRRKKRRQKPEGEPSGKRRPAEAAVPEPGAEDLDAGTFKEESLDIDLEEEDQDDRGQKSSFRSIPTWSEAIGVIVAKNMESRGKRSSDGGGPPRGPNSRRRRR